LSNYDASFELTRYLIEQGGLELIKDARMKELAQYGMIGSACTDGRYSLFIANGWSKYSDIQHFNRSHGGGFMLGLIDPALYDINPKHWEYISSARQVILQDLRDALAEHIGKVVLCVIHGPNCKKMKGLDLAYHNMILAALASDDFATKALGVIEDVVLPILIVDWTPDVTDVRSKSVEAYVVKNACRTLIPEYLETH